MELDFINENAWYITSFVEPRVEDLYRKVEEYVRRNYIYNYVFEDGFLVGYKNEGYELKRVFGPCVLYSLAKLGDYSPDYIDLERVMSDELTQKEQLKSNYRASLKRKESKPKPVSCQIVCWLKGEMLRRLDRFQKVFFTFKTFHPSFARRLPHFSIPAAF